MHETLLLVELLFLWTPGPLSGIQTQLRFEYQILGSPLKPCIMKNVCNSNLSAIQLRYLDRVWYTNFNISQESIHDYRTVLKRLQMVPTRIQQTMELLKQGVRVIEHLLGLGCFLEWQLCRSPVMVLCLYVAIFHRLNIVFTLKLENIHWKHTLTVFGV